MQAASSQLAVRVHLLSTRGSTLVVCINTDGILYKASPKNAHIIRLERPRITKYMQPDQSKRYPAARHLES